jgi:hypothetical protein
MNIKQMIKVLTEIQELINCDVYDANAMQELESESNWPSKRQQFKTIEHVIRLLWKVENFTGSIVYFNSNKEVQK